jgi:hypothetical protein
MPLTAVHIHMQQHGHAQANPRVQTPCVPREAFFWLSFLTNLQYTAVRFQRNSKSGRFRRVFSLAAALRHFATSA